MTVPTDEDSSFPKLFREGTRLLQQGKAEQARTLLEQAHRLEPEHSDAALNLSGAYILSGNFKKALPLLLSLAERTPDNAMVWTNLGAAHLGNPILARDQEQQAAIAAFKRALEINPAAPSVAYNLGLIYRDRQELDEAIFWFEEALKANPNDRHARNILTRLTTSSSDST